MEEIKKCKCGNKKFLVLIILILLVGGFFVWKNFGDKEEKGSVEKSSIEVTDNSDGTKTVKNVEDNLQAVVDNSWILRSDNANSINLLKKGDGQPLEDTGLSDGINLSIKVLENSENLDVNNWLANKSILTEDEIDSVKLVEMSGTKLYVFEDSYDGGDFLPEGVENIVFSIMFVKDNEIVNYSCDIITDKDKKDEYKNICLELVKQNIK